MSERPSEVKKSSLSLVERKQRAARSRIIDAADALFAERGFDNVSVTDIAERAEVGRTTFFRHFGDKTEVVFAKEQAMFDTITDATAVVWTPTQSAGSLAGALSSLEPLVVRLCTQATSDLAAYERRARLLDAHEELRARDALKNQYLSDELAKVLLKHDVAPAIATMAAQLALACYSSGRILATAPSDLVTATRAAFRSTLAMNSAPAEV
ncbi:TetR family transcriptional regulator [Glaciihabitans tibetensis]|uniref:TetR family transcriptional regulator n=1 Tax=Glaciihabitans tibetensis TaxID=1266600 RepID=A0A2T0VBC0_9MICO|nr:TetR/AcrR family transcriptional regulator [Glaciihabitans tibetensis]PRY67423.1 TetR family transcriptional regulator [Glaciihabitans tibetensis]